MANEIAVKDKKNAAMTKENAAMAKEIKKLQRMLQQAGMKKLL